MSLTRRTALVMLFATLTTPALAGSSRVYAKGDLAIGGYDPVAYFKDSNAKKGASKHSVKWNGAVWRFKSAKNKALFEANPDKYAPQYGGFCAYAMARGDYVPTSPKAWKIYKGKLYLNYNTIIKKVWDRDKKGYVSKADKHWPS